MLLRMPEILKQAGVLSMISECQLASRSVQWYVFGSAIDGKGGLSDIDILCIVEESNDIQLIKRQCQPYLDSAPIHLRLLTKRDEGELRFLERTRVLPILA